MDSVFNGSQLAITVCDSDGIVVAISSEAARRFEANGSSVVVGKSIYDCHAPPSRSTIERLLATGSSNVYSVEKGGARRLVYQGPWEQGQEHGLLEVSFAIPRDVPLRMRDELPAQPTLETARLLLKPLEPAVALRIAELAGDARIAAMTHLPHPYLPEMATQFVAQMRVGWARRTAAAFGIHLKNLSGEPLIGITALHCDAMERAVAEGGYWLGVEHHRKGYATEAFTALTDWGFGSFELRRIGAYTFVGNVASERVLQKTGFSYEGTARQARMQLGVCYDVKAWGLLKHANALATPR